MWKELLLNMFIVLLVLSAVCFGQSVIEVPSGENKIDDAIYAAAAGDTLVLTSNGGYYHEFFATEITVPLVIKAADGREVKPVWYCDDLSRIITLRDDLTLQGIKFVGDLGTFNTERCIGIDSCGTETGTSKLGYKLKIDNCEFVNFNVGSGRAINGHPYSRADSVIITNSYFAHINNRAIYFKDPKEAPSADNFLIENCTFWDIGEDVIYVDNFEDVLTTDMSFYANHITIHDPGMADPGIKSIYPKYIDGALIKNSMVTRSIESTATDPARIYGESSAALFLLDWNVDKISLRDGADIDDSTGTNYLHGVDPVYFDSDNGDFHLDASSPAVGFGEDGTTLGDSRWFDYDRVTIDGRLGEWPEWTKIAEKIENDTLLGDTTELKAVWFTIDKDKIAMRADFFGPCNWRGGGDTKPWNINGGGIRFYFKDPLGNKWKMKFYQEPADSSFTKAKIVLEAGPDAPVPESGRIKGLSQWNESGTSVEVWFPSDSLTFPIAEWNPDDTLQFRVQIYTEWGNQMCYMPESGYYYFTVSEVDFYTSPPIVSVGDNTDAIPNAFKLSQNYPNPFNPTTNISYNISKRTDVKLSVYNILGQQIATLVNEIQNAGAYSIHWNALDVFGNNVSSGIYFYRIETDDNTMTKKMLLVR